MAVVRLALLLALLAVCSVSAASTLPSDGLNQDFTSGRIHHRSLLQAAPVPAPPPSPPPVVAPTTPPVKPPSPPPVRAPSPPTTQVLWRTYLMWVGVGAAIFIVASVAVFCLCRKCGQNKIRGAQRLPPLPRYH